MIPSSKFSKNVARDLIYGCWCRGKRIAGTQFPPISQLMVATILKQDGNNRILYDAPATGKGIEDIRDEISKDYDVVITLTSTMTINEDSEVFKELKLANPNLKVIVYGAHPTFMPKQTLSRESIDVAVQREPEFIIRDLIRAFEKKDGSFECDLSKLHTKAFYNQVFTNMKDTELPKYIRHFYRSFYLRPSYIIKWFKRIKSLDELKRIILAATQVFDFVFRGD